MPPEQQSQQPQSSAKYQYRQLPDGKWGEFDANATEEEISAKIDAYGSNNQGGSSQLSLPGGTPRLQQAAQGLSPSLTQPTDFEKRNAVPSRWDAGNEVAGMELRSAGLPTSISDIPDWGQRLVGAAPGQQPFWKSMITGPQAGSPEATPLGRAASLTGTAAGIAGAGEVRPGLSAAKSEIANIARTPEGNLTPTATTLSRVGGGVTGATAGGLLGTKLGPEGVLGEGYLGYRTGAALGPVVADWVLPNRPETPDFMGGAYSDYAGESGKAVPVSKGPGPYTGPSSVPKGNPTPFSGATSSATPNDNPPLPAIPQGSSTPYRSTSSVDQAPPTIVLRRPTTPAPTTTDEGVVIAPEPRQPAPGVNPNNMASVPRQSLTSMAASGTPGAGPQLQQLGQPIIYTVPEGFPGPRANPAPPQFQPESSPAPQPQQPLNLPSQQPMVESTESAPQSVRLPKPKTGSSVEQDAGIKSKQTYWERKRKADLENKPAESADEAARRGASGVNPVQRSLRRNIEKNRKRS